MNPFLLLCCLVLLATGLCSSWFYSSDSTANYFLTFRNLISRSLLFSWARKEAPRLSWTAGFLPRGLALRASVLVLQRALHDEECCLHHAVPARCHHRRTCGVQSWCQRHMLQGVELTFATPMFSPAAGLWMVGTDKNNWGSGVSWDFTAGPHLDRESNCHAVLSATSAAFIGFATFRAFVVALYPVDMFPTVPCLLQSFNHKATLNFVSKCLFCNNWHDHVLFLLSTVMKVDYIDLYSNIEPALHFQDIFHLVVM